MVLKAKKLYGKLSRKELQRLCKLYGLPANKSHSQLERSLLAFLEKESHSKCKGSGVNHRKAIIKSSAEKCLSSSKEDAVEFRPEIVHRDMDNGRCSTENAFASPVESSAKAHSSPFQFYVRSEDGLNLYVDLNSSPSDWTQKFTSEIHIFENVQHDKSWSLQDDLEYLKEGEKAVKSSHGNLNSEEVRDGHADGRSSPCSEVNKIDQSELDRTEKGEMSLDSLSIRMCSVSEKSKENRLPSCPNSDSPGHIISVVESCAKTHCAVVLDSDVIDAHDDRKSIYDTVVNSISCCPSSHATSDHATANPSRCQNRMMQNDSSLSSAAMVHPRCSVSSSIEMPSSEVASCNKDASGFHCENGGPMGDFDTMGNKECERSGLANSSELNHMLVSAEEGERSNILNKRESSKSSQFVKPLKTCFDPDNLNSSGGHPKKRKHVEVEHQSEYAQAHVKILRSMKRRKNLPRRSMRLMSK